MWDLLYYGRKGISHEVRLVAKGGTAIIGHLTNCFRSFPYRWGDEWMLINLGDIVEIYGKNEEKMKKNGAWRDKFWGSDRCLSLFGWGVAISDAKSAKKACGVGERGLSLQCQKKQIPKGVSKKEFNNK